MSDHHPTQRHLLLIDVSGFFRRAYHGGNPNRFREDGLPTWALEGLLRLLWRLLGAAQHDQPDYAAAVLDAPGKTFRHELFAAYKGNRPARDAELEAQMPYVFNICATMGIQPVEFNGFEADDLLATLAHWATEEGIRTTLVSSDKDLLQCVNHLVTVLDPVQHLRHTVETVRSGKFGVAPEQVPDVQALAGDDVDNIPGIDGIGLKTAQELVRSFGTVEEVVAAARDRETACYFSPSQRVQMKKPDALARLQLYRGLAILRRDVPLSVKWDDLALQPIMREHVDTILRVLGASGRFESIFAATPQLQRVVPPTVGAAEDWWNEELLVPGQPVPDEPQVGCYERRLNKKGVFVPALIWREDEIDPITGVKTGQQILRCTVGREPADPVLEWPRLCRRPITSQKYEFEMADRAWLSAYDPAHPKVNPHSPVDRTALPAVHCSKPASKKRNSR
jgi:DNA polymerase-1